MHVFTFKKGWTFERNNIFSLDEFRTWLYNNHIHDDSWKFSILPDDRLNISILNDADAVAFKLKFVNNNQEPMIF